MNITNKRLHFICKVGGYSRRGSTKGTSGNKGKNSGGVMGPPPEEIVPITAASINGYQMYPVLSLKGQGYYVVGVPAKLSVLRDEKSVWAAVRDGQMEFIPFFDLEDHRDKLKCSLGNMGEELVSFDNDYSMQEVHLIKKYFAFVILK